ncbi:MAG TPA: DsbA family protein, partial [Gemmatimonadota bacterium]|nr:DsbA family protein [Gemmatimonadota bacterium]
PAARGAPDAALVIVEFSDFQCPYCAGARPVLDSLFARHGDHVRLEYRHYPLSMHEHAARAAQAAVEAQRQGAFWPYHDLLFAHQNRLTDADLVGYADSLGLDTAAFAAALAEGRHEAAVQSDVSFGRALGITGTPTFFVNGYRLVGVPPLWVFEVALEAFLVGRVEPRPLARP